MLSVACKEDDIQNARSGREAAPQLKYEVITVSDVLWNEEYDDNLGNRVGAMPLNLPSGWTYTFKPDSLPFEMFVFAESNCIYPDSRDDAEDVIINFYVDDKLVKTDTNTWAKGVTSLQYMIK